MEYWKAPQGIRIPDFIICGAMKCGTSTVHRILDCHPEIYIPDSEINFFDMDDHFEHSDFSIHANGRWFFPVISDKPETYWEWYSNFFSNAPISSLLGEDSTCYIASPNAPLRISLQEKPIKAIVCLRHPTKRAYSQYWHMLRTGRSMFSFEDTIRFTPHYVLSRSMYLQQIRTFLRHIPRDRVFFFILEEYLANKKEVAQRLVDFIGLSFKDLPDDALDVHSNKGRIPKFINLQTLKNRILRGYGNTHYVGKLPYSTPNNMQDPKLLRAINRLCDIINPTVEAVIPKMNSHTKMFLDQFYQRELHGLNEIVGFNVTDLWFMNE